MPLFASRNGIDEVHICINIGHMRDINQDGVAEKWKNGTSLSLVSVLFESSRLMKQSCGQMVIANPRNQISINFS